MEGITWLVIGLLNKFFLCGLRELCARWFVLSDSRKRLASRTGLSARSEAAIESACVSRMEGITWLVIGLLNKFFLCGLRELCARWFVIANSRKRCLAQRTLGTQRCCH